MKFLTFLACIAFATTVRCSPVTIGNIKLDPINEFPQLEPQKSHLIKRLAGTKVVPHGELLAGIVRREPLSCLYIFHLRFCESNLSVREKYFAYATIFVSDEGVLQNELHVSNLFQSWGKSYDLEWQQYAADHISISNSTNWKSPDPLDHEITAIDGIIQKEVKYFGEYRIKYHAFQLQKLYVNKEEGEKWVAFYKFIASEIYFFVYGRPTSRGFSIIKTSELKSETETASELYQFMDTRLPLKANWRFPCEKDARFLESIKYELREKKNYELVSIWTRTNWQQKALVFKVNDKGSRSYGCNVGDYAYAGVDITKNPPEVKFEYSTFLTVEHAQDAASFNVLFLVENT